MGLWKLWLVGVVIVIITVRYCWERDMYKEMPNILEWILISLSVIIVGGIPVGWFVGWLVSCGGTDISSKIGCVLVFFAVYASGVAILFGGDDGIKRIKYVNEEYAKRIIAKRIVAFVLLVISSIAWFFPYYNYFKGIQYRTETVITSSCERKLFSYEGIILQDISGSFRRGFGTVDTSNELLYGYLNENDEGEYDSAPIDNSKIIFFENGEEPRVEIICKREQTVETNDTTGEISTMINTGSVM